MQLKDFKSAEEHYRKALSFEPDKNKQCNLAMCLMRMNKLTEAKFLLQATGISSDSWPMDESFAKSYERASQMMVELEAHDDDLEPVKRTDICSSFKNMILGAFTEFPYEKKSNLDWKMSHGGYVVIHKEADCALKPVYGSPFYNRNIPKVPFTQPRRSSLSTDNGVQRNVKANNGGFCRKLSFFEQPAETELALTCNEERLKNFQLKPYTKEVLDKGCFKEVENPKSEEILTACKKSTDNLTCSKHRKSWADMVEEEQALESWEIDPKKYTGNHFPESLSSYQTPGKMSVGSVNKEVNDENVNSNVIPRTPIEGSNELEGGKFAQPQKLLRPQNQSTAKNCSALTSP